MPHECTNCNRTFPDGSKEMLSGCPDCGGNKFQYRPEGGRLDGSALDDADGPASAGDSPPVSSGSDPPSHEGQTSASATVSNAASTLRDLVGRSDDDAPDSTGHSPDSDPIGGSVGGGSSPTPAEGDPDAGDPSRASTGVDPDAGGEDAAQASARSSVVDPEDIPGEDPADSGTTPEWSRSDDSGSGFPSDDPGASADPQSGGSGRSPADESSSDDDSNLADLREELNDQFESIKIVEPGQYELNLMELYDRDEYIISLKEDGRYVIEVPETWRGDTP